MTANISYRPDIDGLRAIAVLLVVFYHAGFGIISGGFIGVDIFFVLSGYLITAIIYRELQKDRRFSFRVFYLRRIRRLMPAFIVVMFCTTVAAMVILLPHDLIAYSRSLFAAILFIANLHFWKSGDGYFSVNTDELPLLHTWSLSVEEQFYLLWPLCLLVAYRYFDQNKLWILTGLAMLLALALSEWGAFNSPSASYYWLPTRAFELLIGAFMAIGQSRMPAIQGWLNDLMSIIGGVLIIGSGLLLDRSMVFPGLNAFWACLGTAMLIYSGMNGPGCVNRLIATKPFVAVGLASYSLYLWHWPILAFMHYRLIELTTINGFAAIFVSGVLAYLTWRFVENPFRFIYKFDFEKSLVRIFLLPGLFISAASVAVIGYDGVPARFSAISDKSVDVPLFASSLNGYCHVTDAMDIEYLIKEKGLSSNFENLVTVVEKCRLGHVSGELSAILFGDSHAGYYAPFVDYLSKKSGVTVTQLSGSGCIPVLHSRKIGEESVICEKFSERYEQTASNYDIAIIAGKWVWDLEQPGMQERIADMLEFTSSRVASVIVLGQIPTYRKDIGMCYRRSLYLGVSADECIKGGYYETYIEANHKIAALANRHSNVQFVNINEKICDFDCSPFIGDTFIYFDDDHLNITGALRVAGLYEGELLLTPARAAH